ncbi:MAG: ABC transporter ATP-binding protein [Dactylosporangium sp.]|nr:ABC transporter ATP-binding protein [Dactylosporangium sp.]NNJ60209.1 ABC transporter ATP-binding protein [Dactylosporangium sp.]
MVIDDACTEQPAGAPGPAPDGPARDEAGGQAIRVRGLRKCYGRVEAVRGLDLTVRRGEIAALLGPNGAGKTTTVEILEGHRSRTSGDVQVLGADPRRPTREWRARIGLVLQSTQMPAELTVGELVARFAAFYPSPRDVDETIELVGLTAKRRARAGRLSGGQQRRLDVALALVGDPELVFLDEPTTGFDPQARRQAWSMIDTLRTLSKTVLLTTHYLDEAEALADRIAVVVDGRIAAEGTPATLGGRDSAPCEVRFCRPERLDPAVLDLVAASAEGSLTVVGGVVTLRTADPAGVLGPLLDWARAHGTELPGLEVRRPSLEDVYLAITGGLGARRSARRLEDSR